MKPNKDDIDSDIQDSMDAFAPIVKEMYEDLSPAFAPKIDWERVARVQCRKLHAVIHLPEVKKILDELEWK